MPSTLSWLDHDSAAHEQSLRILALFEEKDTRDELGIGGIRDSLWWVGKSCGLRAGEWEDNEEGAKNTKKARRSF